MYALICKYSSPRRPSALRCRRGPWSCEKFDSALVGAVCDRPHSLDSRKSARSQTAPTAAVLQLIHSSCERAFLLESTNTRGHRPAVAIHEVRAQKPARTLTSERLAPGTANQPTRRLCCSCRPEA